MEDTFNVSLTYFNNEQENELYVSIVNEKLYIGGALDVSLDKTTRECILTFWDEDGTKHQTQSNITDKIVSTPTDLGKWAVDAGYSIESNCDAFIGLYIIEKFDKLWFDFCNNCKFKNKENATEIVQ